MIELGDSTRPAVDSSAPSEASEEVKRRGVQESKNIDYAKQHHTPHCWLPAKVMYPANSTKRFTWLTRSTSMLLMKNVQIYCIVFVRFAS